MMMRLLNKKSLLYALIIVVSVIILLPKGHSALYAHSMSLDTKSASIAQPTWELYQLAVKEGITPTEWSIVWKGTLTVNEEKQLRDWVAHSSFQEQVEEVTKDFLPHHNLKISQNKWSKEKNNTFHQLQVISFPEDEKQQSQFIYTWYGSKMDAGWHDEYHATESKLISFLQQLPQIFSCIEGIRNDTLEYELSDDNNFEKWMTDTLQGEVTHRVSDQNFISVNGFIPKWEEHLILDGEVKINLQLSARYNALDEKTRVMIGYPLILKEH